MRILVDITLISFLIIVNLIQVHADIRRECRKQSEVSWDSLLKLKAGNFVKEDSKLKCYLKCFMQRNGIFGNNDIDVEKAMRHLPSSLQTQSRKTLEHCKTMSSTDPCDKAFQVAKCFFKTQPEMLKNIPFV